MDLIIRGPVKNGERRALIAFCGGGERNKNNPHTSSDCNNLLNFCDAANRTAPLL
jgi:hypothetical protein